MRQQNLKTKKELEMKTIMKIVSGPTTKSQVKFANMLYMLLSNVIDMNSLAVRFGKKPIKGIIKISLYGEAPRRILLSNNPKGFYYADSSKKWGGDFLEFYMQASEFPLSPIEAMLEMAKYLCSGTIPLKGKDIKKFADYSTDKLPKYQYVEFREIDLDDNEDYES